MLNESLALYSASRFIANLEILRFTAFRSEWQWIIYFLALPALSNEQVVQRYENLLSF